MIAPAADVAGDFGGGRLLLLHCASDGGGDGVDALHGRAHRGDGSGRLARGDLHFADLPGDLDNRVRRLAGEAFHLVCDHGKAFACLARTGRFDGGIQGEQVGFLGDGADERHHVRDFLGRGRQLIGELSGVFAGAHGFAHHRERVMHPLTDFEGCHREFLNRAMQRGGAFLQQARGGDDLCRDRADGAFKIARKLDTRGDERPDNHRPNIAARLVVYGGDFQLHRFVADADFRRMRQVGRVHQQLAHAPGVFVENIDRLAEEAIHAHRQQMLNACQGFLTGFVAVVDFELILRVRRHDVERHFIHHALQLEGGDGFLAERLEGGGEIADFVVPFGEGHGFRIGLVGDAARQIRQAGEGAERRQQQIHRLQQRQHQHHQRYAQHDILPRMCRCRYRFFRLLRPFFDHIAGAAQLILQRLEGFSDSLHCRRAAGSFMRQVLHHGLDQFLRLGSILFETRLLFGHFAVDRARQRQL